MNSPGFMKEKPRKHSELATVESQRNDLTAEEFPEGAYGMDLAVQSVGKSTPWRKGQRVINPYDYENRTLHKGISRHYPDKDPVGEDAE